jgi:hypothetical protein
MLNISLSAATFSSCFSLRTRKRAAIKTMRPCPASPNMTAKRKGNVATVYTAGFTSRYVFTP